MSWTELKRELQEGMYNDDGDRIPMPTLRIHLAASDLSLTEVQRAALDWMLASGVPLYDCDFNGMPELHFTSIPKAFQDNYDMNAGVGLYSRAHLPELLEAVGRKLAELGVADVVG